MPLKLSRTWEGSVFLGVRSRLTLRARRMFAAGGEAREVPIIAAGGEYVVSPEAVQAIGNGDLERGHNTLDELVKSVRKNNIKTARLEAPVNRLKP